MVQNDADDTYGSMDSAGDGMFLNTDAMEYMHHMEPESVDLICTDPPYRVVSGGNKSPIAEGYRNSVLEANNGRIFNHNDISLPAMFKAMYRVLKPGTHCYVMTNKLNLFKMVEYAEAAGFYLHNLLRWDKPNFNANRWYMIDCEYTLFLAKRPVKPINNMGSKQGFPARFDRRKIHPTEKPVPLMEHYILNSTQPGELVFDPFAGCGSTLLAAARNGRRYLGCELDPMWFNVGYVRLCQA